MSNRTFKLIVTVREIKTYAVNILAPTHADALVRVGKRVDESKDHLRGFQLRNVASRAITQVRDGK